MGGPRAVAAVIALRGQRAHTLQGVSVVPRSRALQPFGKRSTVSANERDFLMIRVIATIELKPGQRAAFLTALHANVPNVLAESGCREYVPMVDTPSGLPPQPPLRPDVVTIVEAWDSLEALLKHLSGLPHMLRYREATQDMVVNLTVQVLTPV